MRVPPPCLLRDPRGGSKVEALLVTAMLLAAVAAAWSRYGNEVQAKVDAQATCVDTFDCKANQPQPATGNVSALDATYAAEDGDEAGTTSGADTSGSSDDGTSDDGATSDGGEDGPKATKSNPTPLGTPLTGFVPLGTNKLTVDNDDKGRPSLVKLGDRSIELSYPPGAPGKLGDLPDKLTIRDGDRTATWTITPCDNASQTWKNADGDRWRGSFNITDKGIGIVGRDDEGRIAHAIVVNKDGVKTVIDPEEVKRDNAKHAELEKAADDARKKADEAAIEALEAQADGLRAQVEVQREEARLKQLVVDDATDRQRRGAPPTAVKTERLRGGGILDLDGKDRPVMVTTAGGSSTRVEYDRNGNVSVIAVREDATHPEQEKVWTRRGEDQNVRSVFEGPRGPFVGTGVIIAKDGDLDPTRRRGTVFISHRYGALGFTPDGGFFEETRRIRRIVGPDGAARIESRAEKPRGELGPWTTVAEEGPWGLSRVQHGGKTWERVGEDAWIVAGGDADNAETRRFELAGQRLVATTWDEAGNRTVVETRLVEGSIWFKPDPESVTFHPDTDPQHRLLDERRAELVALGVLDPRTSLGEMRELLVTGMIARNGYLRAGMAQRRDWLESLRKRRILDSDAYETAKHAVERLERQLTAMDRTLGPSGDSDTTRIDLAGVDLVKWHAIHGASFYDPKVAGSTPFKDVDQILEKYKKEIPGWDERGLAALQGAERAVQRMVKSAIDNPALTAGIVVLTIVAPEVMVPLLTVVGTARGGVEIYKGVTEIQQGEQKGDAAKYLEGWRKVGGGGTEVGVSLGGYIGFARARAAARAAEAPLACVPVVGGARPPATTGAATLDAGLLRGMPAGKPSTSLPPAPDGAVLRYNPNNSYGELHHLAQAMEVNPTLRIRVGTGQGTGGKAMQRHAEDYLVARFGKDRVVGKAEYNRTPANLKPDSSEHAATGTIVHAMRRDPVATAAALRKGLPKEVPQGVRDYVDGVLGDRNGKLLIIWNREKGATGAGADRAMPIELLRQIVQKAEAEGFQPVIMGPPPAGGVKALPGKPLDMTGHHKTIPGVQDQLMMFEYLNQRGAVGQVGMMSGGLDQAAFVGMPTISIFAQTPSYRMGHLAEVLPTFREVTPGRVGSAIEHLRRGGPPETPRVPAVPPALGTPLDRKDPPKR